MSRTARAVVLAGTALLVVVGVWRELAAFPGDDAARVWVSDHPLLPVGIRDVSLLLSTLGTPAVALLSLLLGVWAIRRRWGGREALGLLLAAAAVIVAELLQDVLGRGEVQLVPTAYPSGHVVWAAAAGGYLVLRAHRRGVREVAWPAALVVVLMGPERIAIGAHGVSDVLGGYGLGLAWAVAVDAWVSRRPASPAAASPAGRAAPAAPGR